MDKGIYLWDELKVYDLGYGTRRITLGTNPCKEISLDTETKKENTMNKLYEINMIGQVLYGTKLAVNSKGQWVMEVKGTGEILAVNPSAVEEVLPHTIGVRFDAKGIVYHYLAEASKYKVGDLFVMDAPDGRAIVQVVEVDSKSTHATKQFTPLAKLVTK